jgi:hypothetical protein
MNKRAKERKVESEVVAVKEARNFDGEDTDGEANTC